MFEIDASIIDAGQLEQRIRASVLQKKIPDKFFNVSDKSVNRNDMNELLAMISHEIDNLRERYTLVEKPIISTRPVIGKLIMFCKKAFRKMTRWLFKTYYDQQSQINGDIVRTLSEIAQLQELMIMNYMSGENSDEN